MCCLPIFRQLSLIICILHKIIIINWTVIIRDSNDTCILPDHQWSCYLCSCTSVPTERNPRALLVCYYWIQNKICNSSQFIICQHRINTQMSDYVKTQTCYPQSPWVLAKGHTVLARLWKGLGVHRNTNTQKGAQRARRGPCVDHKCQRCPMLDEWHVDGDDSGHDCLPCFPVIAPWYILVLANLEYTRWASPPLLGGGGGPKYGVILVNPNH